MKILHSKYINSLYFLHVAKAGGTAMKSILRNFNHDHPDRAIGFLGHDVSLKLIRIFLPWAKVIFFVREPISRAESAFYFRQRKGLPGYFEEWSQKEVKVFNQFPDFNALAEALSSDDSNIQKAANNAFETIHTLRWNLSHFLASTDHLSKSEHKIFFLGAQESFNNDLNNLIRIIGGDESYASRVNQKSANRTASPPKVTLSPMALESLQQFLANDIEIYNWCVNNKDRINRRTLEKHTKV